jgi:hypothetical protein
VLLNALAEELDKQKQKKLCDSDAENRTGCSRSLDLDGMLKKDRRALTGESMGKTRSHQKDSRTDGIVFADGYRMQP